MTELHSVLITLGSNVDREHNLPQAIAMLRHCSKITLETVSPIYETQPVGGGPNQTTYFNAAALVKTSLSPAALKETLRKIEQALGRVRTVDKYAPRPIDLDIALYDEQVFDLEGWHIPDPDIAKYAHVAWPLADLAPDRAHPELGVTLYEIAKNIKFSDEETDKPMKTQLTVLPTNGRHPGHYATNLEVVDPDEIYDPKFEALVRQMLIHVGEDADREGLKRTPLRVAKAMDFLTSGYTMALEEIVNNALFEDPSKELVIVKDIEFYSLCEHHMLPFFGKAHIGYLPKGKIIGLSKLARIVDLYARRLQVQERLTSQIADTVMEILNPHGVAVVLEASHFCMMMRGVQKQNSSTITSAMRGLFQSDPRTRQEFMQLLKG